MANLPRFRFQGLHTFTAYKIPLYADLPRLGCIGWSPRWDAGQHWDAGMMIDALSLSCYFSWYLQSHISLNIKRRELATELLALYLLKDSIFSDFWYIYTQVTGAVEHIQTGTKLLQKAKKLQKNTRKCTCIAIIMLLIIILIVILSLKPWSWGK
jgi:hypothetical protein